MDYPRFSTEDVAKAAGIPTATLANWIKRLGSSMIEPDTDFDGPQDRVFLGTGRARLFKRRTAIRIAIMAQVARFGLPIQFAHDCAVKFVDVTGGMPRLPGELFAYDGTALIIEFKPDDTITAEVNFMKHAQLMLLGKAVCVIDLEAVLARVDKSLLGAR